MANYTFTFKDDSLEHHGIDGQKWGVRNGPPYPLSEGQHSAAEKRAMRKEGRDTYRLIKKYNKNSKNAYKLAGHKNPDKSVRKKTFGTIDDNLDSLLSIYKKNNSMELESYFNKLAEDILGKYANKPIYTKEKRYAPKKKGFVYKNAPSGYNQKSVGTAKDILSEAMLSLGKDYLYTINYLMDNNTNTGTIVISDKKGNTVETGKINYKDWE